MFPRMLAYTQYIFDIDCNKIRDDFDHVV